MSKSKEYISSSGSDEDDEPRQKKVKKVVEKKAAKPNQAAKSSQEVETKHEIGRMRYVSVSEFRGKKMISIREYYTTDDGEERPGKKGISLTLDQWEKLKLHIKDVDSELKNG